MMALALAPFMIQALAILLDEFIYHHKRGLPLWERLGHPVDTFMQLACMMIPLFLVFSRNHLIVFAIAATLSTLLITKDEHIHARQCGWQEHWLHSILFIVHPTVLIATAYLWASPAEHRWFFPLLKVQILLMTIFWIYQITYWSFYGARARLDQSK